MTNQFRLDDLLAREVVPQWFEGVALVQLVCHQLHAGRGESSGFPGPEDILIAAGGSVTAVGRSDGKPGETAARVLGLMLGNDAPVRLRLVLSQATTADNGFTSLTEFSEALKYFERPNPEAIVEAFRQRALAAPRRQLTPRVALEANIVTDTPSLPLPPSQRPRVSAVAVTVTAAALACAAIWLTGSRATGVSLRGALMDRADAGAPADSSTKKVATSAAAERPTKPRSPAAMSVRQREALPEMQVTATTVSYAYPTLSPPRPSKLATYVSDLPTMISVGSIDSQPLASVAPTEVTVDRIYSEADAHVTVPLNVYPRFRKEPTALSGGSGTTLEVTIAADGLVERVRMLTAPRNIHEFMLLSAAKAWRFEPARIEGRAVRFRELITLTTRP